MKKLFACFLACQFTISALCQGFPDAVVIKPEELKMKECSFDKEADAVILVHEAKADHDDQYKLITHHRVRIKILKEKGIRHADIRIPYYLKDNFEHIEVTRARIYNEVENSGPMFEELDRKSFYRKAISKYFGEMVFTFPSVKVGSIIEYTYQSTMANYAGLEDWRFQEDLPVVESNYSVVILPDYEFAYRVQKREEYPIEIKSDKSQGRISFSMKNIPGLRNEPYMDARKDYLQMVTFQLAGSNVYYKKKYMTTWEEVIRELNISPNFGKEIGKSLQGTDEFIREVKLDPSPASRLTRVYNYVRSNVVWNGINSKYTIDGMKQAWAKKTGTNGEINLALITLLREVDLDAHPILVSERHHGKVLTDYPFIDQFNTVFAYVQIDNKKYYLDGTDKVTPSHIIPNGILNTKALIVNRKGGGLVDIKDENFEYRDYVNVTAVLAPDGKLQGKVFMSSSDYARSERLSSLKSNSSKYLKDLRGESGNIEIDSFKVVNEENDTLPLQHLFKFSSTINGTGDYTFLPTTLFSELDGNPFLSDTRFSNVNFGYRQRFFLNTYITIPNGVIVDALPKAVKLADADQTIVFTRQVLFDEKSRNLVSRISIEMKKSLYDTNEYGSLYEFYKKMYEYLGEQIVIKKS